MPSQPLTHLVLVCCHATFHGQNPDEESSWILQDFQKSNPDTGKVGEHHTFMEHIAAAASITAHDPSALLLFSGGKTQQQVDLTEAESYRRVCDIKQQFDTTTCDIEPYATDSYQNLLFSIIRFRSITGSYPTEITVITHAFKERRFLELHGPAIRFPASNLRVLGINPPMTLTELQDVQQGELARGYDPFAQSLYGTSESLNKKRAVRGWDLAHLNEFASDVEDEVKKLREWTGGASGNETFPGSVPWERNDLDGS